MIVRLAAPFLFGVAAFAQTVCPATPRYSACDLVFDIPTAHGDRALDLHAEFRSPTANTALVNAFWDGGTKWVIRFTPTEPGDYTYRLTSEIESLNGKVGQFTATPNDKKGWLRAANVHHFALVEGNQLTPYLWMGAVVPNFASIDRGSLEIAGRYAGGATLQPSRRHAGRRIERARVSRARNLPCRRRENPLRQ